MLYYLIIILTVEQGYRVAFNSITEFFVGAGEIERYALGHGTHTFCIQYNTSKMTPIFVWPPRHSTTKRKNNEILLQLLLRDDLYPTLGKV